MAGSNTGSKQSAANLLANRPAGYTTGRPTKFTEATLKKLQEAFAIGASDKEACFYADVTPTALYNYQEKHPEFIERKNALKERPVLLARQTVLNNIATDVATARWYLERKRKDEFSSKVENETVITMAQPILGGMAKKQVDAVHSDTDNV